MDYHTLYTGLTPDTSYIITVAGNSSCGAGPVSDIIMTSTAMGPSTTGNAEHSMLHNYVCDWISKKRSHTHVQYFNFKDV